LTQLYVDKTGPAEELPCLNHVLPVEGAVCNSQGVLPQGSGEEPEMVVPRTKDVLPEESDPSLSPKLLPGVLASDG